MGAAYSVGIHFITKNIRLPEIGEFMIGCVKETKCDKDWLSCKLIHFQNQPPFIKALTILLSHSYTVTFADGIMVDAYSDFSASYGWQDVMIEVFNKTMSIPIIEEGSYVQIYNWDDDRVIRINKGGAEI